ncbi:WbqC family protein [Flavobacterium glaciei]|uniref:WbqC-like protein n=1 Tax=Flavobacterium glaciei TaxID=386300 RepID=A0A562Q751_9FLAO|nr:WbqC family protein [Flavobacterium glaciei]RDI58223.1 WbqC-like protein [Flavobacterium glaciei]TWI52010.1 WbqC-like protein [Flavobacterium glaciei]
MNILLHPTYFPSISHFAAMVQSKSITFEIEDNFQKQTNRNRAYIYSPNGIQLLNIPVKHSKESHQKTKDIKIETDFDWQKQHFKSFEAGYRSSPFFEFFEDDIRPIFEKKYTFLLDLNFEIFDILLHCFRMKADYTTTTEYFHEVDTTLFTDFRTLVNGKKDLSIFDSYTQVFDDKHGFINNLSVLDLLFNEGKYAMEYLKTQKLILK